MSKKLRNILAVSLLLVFITPTTVKLLDEAFHHHVYFHSKVKNSDVLHSFHRTCPIPGFTLSFYTIQKQTYKKEKRIFYAKVFVTFIPELFSSELNYSTLLRAPPLLADFI
jgi:hypothetical protein